MLILYFKNLEFQYDFQCYIIDYKYYLLIAINVYINTIHYIITINRTGSLDLNATGSIIRTLYLIVIYYHF